MSTEYYIKRTRPNRLQITKFEETKGPTQVYEVRETPQGLLCDCPGTIHHRYACKHVPMIQEFKQAGEPIPFLLLQ